MKQPHKHAEVLRAIADGIDVQWNEGNGLFDYRDQYSAPNPFYNSHTQWRIKPETKPDVVKYLGLQGQSIGDLIKENNKPVRHAYIHADYSMISHFEFVIKLTFDGETGELKSAEVIK